MLQKFKNVVGIKAFTVSLALNSFTECRLEAVATLRTMSGVNSVQTILQGSVCHSHNPAIQSPTLRRCGSRKPSKQVMKLRKTHSPKNIYSSNFSRRWFFVCSFGIQTDLLRANCSSNLGRLGLVRLVQECYSFPVTILYLLKFIQTLHFVQIFRTLSPVFKWNSSKNSSWRIFSPVTYSPNFQSLVLRNYVLV